jgi:hypothetical protein
MTEISLPHLVHATREPNTHNRDADTVTLYFEGEPTLDQVREICVTQLKRLSLGVDTEDQFFGFEEHPTPVSERAGLHRYEVYPSC